MKVTQYARGADVRNEKRVRKLALVILAALMAAVSLVLIMFNTFNRRYQTNIADESADHLIEINA